jgi:CRISPR-associated endonuclease/helicase Cas3
MYFDTAAKEFRLIEDKGRSVIVCWKDSVSLIEQLEQSGPSYALMKKLGQYTVNVYESDFKKLAAMGVVSGVEKDKGSLYVIKFQQQYDSQLGLLTDNNWANEMLLI